MRKILKRLKLLLLDVKQTTNEIQLVRETLSELYYFNLINSNSRYRNGKRLMRYGNKFFSQNDEDGIIEEIFKRIGFKNKYFVEIGCGDGLENNTTYLLFKKWKGLWIESNHNLHENIKVNFNFFLREKQLLIDNSFVTKENIRNILKEKSVPKEFDLLSIDIDGNDYWIWREIQNYKPRVVIIEYNASLGPNVNFVIKYNTSFTWKKTNYFGASLKSLELLGKKKGYKLVGCNFSGNNAFFVREDLIKNKFLNPYTSENHYELPRFYVKFKRGHNREIGDFESI